MREFKTRAPLCSHDAQLKELFAGTIVLPAELNAAAVLIGYWNSSIKWVERRLVVSQRAELMVSRSWYSSAVFIAVCLVVAVAINLGGTRYGERDLCTTRTSRPC